MDIDFLLSVYWHKYAEHPFDKVVGGKYWIENFED